MRSPSGHAATRGFSLIETLLAFAILTLVLGGVFGAVHATMKTSAALHAAQRERDGITGLFDLCQQTFPSLPPAARMQVTGPGKPGGPLELAFRNAPQAFAVDAQTLFFGETAMVARPQPNGGYTLGIEYRRIDRQSDGPVVGPLWLPLLRDVQSVSWSFFDAGAWVPRWVDAGRRPGMIRLTVVLLGNSRPWTQTFWLPRTVPALLAVQRPAPPAA